MPGKHCSVTEPTSETHLFNSLLKNLTKMIDGTHTRASADLLDVFSFACWHVPPCLIMNTLGTVNTVMCIGTVRIFQGVRAVLQICASACAINGMQKIGEFHITFLHLHTNGPLGCFCHRAKQMNHMIMRWRLGSDADKERALLRTAKHNQMTGTQHGYTT